MSSSRARASTSKQQLLEWRGLVSNHMEGETSYQFHGEAEVRKEAEDIKRLEGRLEVLEEEAEMLKEALLESVQERTKLMSDIYEHFETIQHQLVDKKLERGEAYTPGVQIISFLKDKEAGLLQVLYQESNPWLVNRSLRANALG